MDPVARAEGPTGDAGYERLSGQDSSFVMFERPSTPMHVAAVAVFESGPLARGRGVDADRIRAYVASRLDGLDHYRQRLEFAPVSGHPFWVDDAHFDLDYHVRHAALPAPGGDRELKQLAGRILSQALDRRRPLWEMWIVEGLQDGRFALITKVHHCMVDGSSGVGLMTRLFRPDADATIPEPRPWSPRPRPARSGATCRRPGGPPSRPCGSRATGRRPSARRSARACVCRRPPRSNGRSGRTGGSSGGCSISPR